MSTLEQLAVELVEVMDEQDRLARRREEILAAMRTAPLEGEVLPRLNPADPPAEGALRVPPWTG